MTDAVSSTDYLRPLEPWPRAMRAHFHTPPGRPELTCFGPGANNWGVQTNQKALAAVAALATDPDLDERRAGMSRDELTDLAVRLLRFSLASHHAGGGTCTDGTPWGHTWISALGVERMMHAVDALEPALTNADRTALRCMLLSESNWLLDAHEVVAGLVEDNVPEANLWNGAVLHRTALLYPDEPRAAAYRDKGSRFLANAISVPADAACDDLLDGRAVRAWHVGPQFFESYALNHHRYLNVGYMVICLSNAAMLHFAFRARGTDAPQALYHHVADLWRLVKACTFPDGRLCRIGGDTRVRYCYCQDYAIPTWLLAAEALGDADAPAFEAAWLAQVRREQAHNGDGSFLSDRCGRLAANSPLYYTRLEADRAAALSMGAVWRRQLDIPAEPPARRPGPDSFAWHDAYHGGLLARGPRRIASFAWRAGEGPMGLCLPAGASDLAEWRRNLTGSVAGDGVDLGVATPLRHEERTFDGGFLTWGELAESSGQPVAEGQPAATIATVRLAFAALPDDATVLVLQRARMLDGRAWLRGVQGLRLCVPNDLFNGNRRTYASAAGTDELPGVGEPGEVRPLAGPWVNVDGRLSVVALFGGELALVRPGRRQIGLRGRPADDPRGPGGMLLCDLICCPCEARPRFAEPDELLFDLAALVRVGADAEATRAYVAAGQAAPVPAEPAGLEGSPAAGAVPPPGEVIPAVRAVRARGADEREYLLVARLDDAPDPADAAAGEDAGRVTLHMDRPATDLVTGETLAPADGRQTLEVPGLSARLLRVE